MSVTRGVFVWYLWICFCYCGSASQSDGKKHGMFTCLFISNANNDIIIFYTKYVVIKGNENVYNKKGNIHIRSLTGVTGLRVRRG